MWVLFPSYSVPLIFKKALEIAFYFFVFFIYFCLRLTTFRYLIYILILIYCIFSVILYVSFSCILFILNKIKFVMFLQQKKCVKLSGAPTKHYQNMLNSFSSEGGKPSQFIELSDKMHLFQVFKLSPIHWQHC